MKLLQIKNIFYNIHDIRANVFQWMASQVTSDVRYQVFDL